MNGTCRMKGCYGNWVINVNCVVFPVLSAACVELGSINCGAFKYGVFWVRSLGSSIRVCHGVWVWSVYGYGVWDVVGVLYLGESKKGW